MDPMICNEGGLKAIVEMDGVTHDSPMGRQRAPEAVPNRCLLHRPIGPSCSIPLPGWRTNIRRFLTLTDTHIPTLAHHNVSPRVGIGFTALPDGIDDLMRDALEGQVDELNGQEVANIIYL